MRVSFASASSSPAVIVLMLVMTVAFGVHLSGPSFQIVPDPAGTLPF